MHATHADVRTLECPVKHGPERLKWLCKVRMAMDTGGVEGSRLKSVQKNSGDGGAE